MRKSAGEVPTINRGRILVGMIHADKIVTVTADDHSFQVNIEGGVIGTAPRTTSCEVHGYKAYASQHRPGGQAKGAEQP